MKPEEPKDEDIDFSDSPELTAEFFERARPFKEIRFLKMMQWIRENFQSCDLHPDADLEIYFNTQGGEFVLGCSAPASEEDINKGAYRQGFSKEKKCFFHTHIDRHPDIDTKPK
jgi:hypothetical protein